MGTRELERGEPEVERGAQVGTQPSVAKVASKRSARCRPLPTSSDPHQTTSNDAGGQFLCSAGNYSLKRASSRRRPARPSIARTIWSTFNIVLIVTGLRASTCTRRMMCSCSEPARYFRNILCLLDVVSPHFRAG
ncbi:hypothetical protein C8Q74DRAFT_617197 [Fomes fomentarius]|nr:hypothetical protein C8Q74DRAFT_617197 [Fomes fomentarius]